MTTKPGQRGRYSSGDSAFGIACFTRGGYMCFQYEARCCATSLACQMCRQAHEGDSEADFSVPTLSVCDVLLCWTSCRFPAPPLALSTGTRLRPRLAFYRHSVAPPCTLQLRRKARFIADSSTTACSMAEYSMLTYCWLNAPHEPGSVFPQYQRTDIL